VRLLFCIAKLTVTTSPGSICPVSAVRTGTDGQLSLVTLRLPRFIDGPVPAPVLTVKSTNVTLLV